MTSSPPSTNSAPHSSSAPQPSEALPRPFAAHAFREAFLRYEAGHRALAAWDLDAAAGRSRHRDGARSGIRTRGPHACAGHAMGGGDSVGVAACRVAGGHETRPSGRARTVACRRPPRSGGGPVSTGVRAISRHGTPRFARLRGLVRARLVPGRPTRSSRRIRGLRVDGDSAEAGIPVFSRTRKR